MSMFKIEDAKNSQVEFLSNHEGLRKKLYKSISIKACNMELNEKISKEYSYCYVEIFKTFGGTLDMGVEMERVIHTNIGMRLIERLMDVTYRLQKLYTYVVSSSKKELTIDDIIDDSKEPSDTTKIEIDLLKKINVDLSQKNEKLMKENQTLICECSNSSEEIKKQQIEYQVIKENYEKDKLKIANF
jgi:hypothetical protein